MHRKYSLYCRYPILCCSMDCSQANEFAVDHGNHADVGVAQLFRTLCDDGEHRLCIGRRAADDAEHFACRGLELKRFLQLALARLLSIEQSRVLDRDYGLVGKGLEQFDLARS